MENEQLFPHQEDLWQFSTQSMIIFEIVQYFVLFVMFPSLLFSIEYISLFAISILLYISMLWKSR